ncbi:GntR family transcriptional regulator [Chondrinema litorale]|uniref:GntR family transcriptional regulator n=1 Tax=Chondrinema litorale TaxID=2994555 RepID=UPI0025427375|nr:winged helix-turn-helix domain-containing protein [Chondrinema litorale]UZR94436.1 winged helix-turn-helix domain-containing protein [Chondrinema litorale]
MNTAETINNYSRIPKYKQVVDSIIADIHIGKFKKGQKIPSINETSFEYLLSRDTVEKAYNELRDKGVIVSVRGKGFYINNTQCIGKKRILVVFNKISTYKKFIFSKFAEAFGDNTIIDLLIHNGDISIMNEVIDDGLNHFHHIVLVPQFDAPQPEVLKLIKRFSPEKLILMDYFIEGLNASYAGVYQDFEWDIYNALSEATLHLKKYEKFNLIFPDKTKSGYCEKIITGFRNFCFHNKLKFNVEYGLSNCEVERRNAYLVILEEDLIDLIKKMKDKSLILGVDTGVISYNDSPIKEILCGGIDVVSTDYMMMSKEIARMIKENDLKRQLNKFSYIKRKSL